MKIFAFFLLLSFLFSSSCEKNEIDLIQDSSSGFYIVSDDKIVLSPNDFEYYDYSSHLIYLRSGKISIKEIEKMNTFTVYANGDPIYSGQTLPAYSSYLPSSLVIHTFPSFFGNEIIGIDFLLRFDSEGKLQPDLREDDRIVNALKAYDQYHPGLTGEILSVNYLSSTDVKVKLQLTNNDSFHYLYLDPEKMGVNLFHYYTNGLYFYDSLNKTAFTHKIETIHPDDWSSYRSEWLSLIRSNEIKILNIVYRNFEQVPSGEYLALFDFPGLNIFTNKNGLQLGKGRIWLGNLHLSRNIVIESN